MRCFPSPWQSSPGRFTVHRTHTLVGSITSPMALRRNSLSIVSQQQQQLLLLLALVVLLTAGYCITTDNILRTGGIVAAFTSSSSSSSSLIALNLRSSTFVSSLPGRARSRTLFNTFAVKMKAKSTPMKAELGSMDPSSSSRSLLKDWVCHRNDSSFHNFSSEEATQIRRALLDWYYDNRRKLPWRGDPPPYDGSTAKNQKPSDHASKEYNNRPSATGPEQTAYGVWVSEIMLQQTRVEAVIPYWLTWMEAFPTIQSLADATPEEVNAKWAGLGFYRRARLLHQAAKYICENLDGRLPQTPKELQSIPGIGPYTASAIASISFDVCVPVVDGNVCRVLSRLRCIAHNIKAPIFKDKIGWNLAGQIVSADGGSNAGDVNQALMELGATYCAPSGTGISQDDPLRDFYWSTQLGAEYYQAIILSSPDKSSTATTVNDFIESEDSYKDKPHCSLCDRERMVSVLMELDSAITELMDNPKLDIDPIDRARLAGHSVFPTSPPKQSKREEVLGVAVLSMTISSSGGDKASSDTYWLLTKRPEKGLLADQWEFPSTTLWDSDDDNKAKAKLQAKKQTNGVAKKRKQPNDDKHVPVIGPTRRRKAIDDLLHDIASPNGSSRDMIRNVNLARLSRESPIEHVFSHVRHTMWIEHAIIELPTRRLPKPLEWRVSSTGREVRWMKESDMKARGVTAGVKKVLKAVEDERKQNIKQESEARIAAEKKRNFFQPRSKKTKKLK